MHAPRRPTRAPFSMVVLATIPMMLAAITVLMVREALAHDGGRPPSAPSASSSPASFSR
ncbi:MAG: hypothetical protein IPP90_06565 [Gemmatimonadaceae bacterium]|nr:hypothetical protein [Gemmatimonadaceae bacterium]